MTEKELENYIKKLIDLTNNNKIIWKKENQDRISRIYYNSICIFKTKDKIIKILKPHDEIKRIWWGKKLFKKINITSIPNIILYEDTDLPLFCFPKKEINNQLFKVIEIQFNKIDEWLDEIINMEEI